MNDRDAVRFLNSITPVGSWHIEEGDTLHYVTHVIGDEADAFRQTNKLVGTIVARLCEAAPDHSGDVVATVDHILRERCAYFACEVARRYGIDMTVDPWRSFPGGTRPRHDLEWQHLRLLIWHHKWFAAAHDKLYVTVGRPAEERARVAIGVYRAAFLWGGVVRAFVNARTAENATTKEAAGHTLAGWARSRLSLSRLSLVRHAFLGSCGGIAQ